MDQARLAAQIIEEYADADMDAGELAFLLEENGVDPSLAKKIAADMRG